MAFIGEAYAQKHSDTKYHICSRKWFIFKPSKCEEYLLMLKLNTNLRKVR